MNVPLDLKYTSEHEWIRFEGSQAVIGITEWAQSELGDIVFVELPEIGAEIELGEPFGTIEAVKAVSDLVMPLSGRVVEVNSGLEDDPMAINRDAFGEGWMLKIELTDKAQAEELIDAEGYRGIIG